MTSWDHVTVGKLTIPFRLSTLASNGKQPSCSYFLQFPRYLALSIQTSAKGMLACTCSTYSVYQPTNRRAVYTEWRSLTTDAVSFIVSVVTETGERPTRRVDVRTYVTGRTARIETQFRYCSRIQHTAAHITITITIILLRNTKQTCVNKNSEIKNKTRKVNGNRKLLTIKQAPIYKRPFK